MSKENTALLSQVVFPDLKIRKTNQGNLRITNERSDDPYHVSPEKVPEFLRLVAQVMDATPDEDRTSMPEQFCLRILNEDHFGAVLSRLQLMGFKWRSRTDENKYRVRGREVRWLSSRRVNQGCLTLTRTRTSRPNIYKGIPELTLHDLYRLDADKKVKLNDDYEAVVTNDGVKVGCQTIPFEAIEKLAEACEKKHRKD